MRDPTDAVTAELPGLPPAPQALTEKQRRQACHYQGPKEVTACRNCRHVDTQFRHPDTLRERLVNRCARHRFDVELGGVCADWEDNRSGSVQ